MSDVDTNPRAVIGGNFPPVQVPKDEAVLGDLQTRYSDEMKELEDIEAAFKTYPAKIVTEDQAKALTDTLGKAGKLKTALDGHRKKEKGPWDKVGKIIQNFFATPKEKLEARDEEYRPRLKAWTDQKEAEARAAAEARAEEERLAADRLRAEQADRAMDLLWAEARQELAEHDERTARAAAEQAERDREAAEALAEAAHVEERRLADEKKARDREEKERNALNLGQIRQHLKAAERLNQAAIDAGDDEVAEEDTKSLDLYIRPGGTISTLAGPVAQSTLLTPDQQDAVSGIRERLEALRMAYNDRLGAKERRRQEKLRKAQEAEDERLAAKRKADREADELRTATAKAEREKAELAVAAAKTTQKTAEKGARAAVQQQTEAMRDQREAGRDVKNLGTDADRAENRADRMDRKIENSSDADFGRIRADLGTTASGTGRWVYDIVDESALRATLGELGPHFTPDALEGAVSRWMATKRAAFTGERVEGLLPGVIFTWDRGLMIRG